METLEIKFNTMTGTIVFRDYVKCKSCYKKLCVEACKRYGTGIIRFDKDIPTLSVSPERLKKGACSECLACEFICNNEGSGILTVDLPLPGID